jgi:hypothetical protein
MHWSLKCAYLFTLTEILHEFISTRVLYVLPITSLCDHPNNMLWRAKFNALSYVIFVLQHSHAQKTTFYIKLTKLLQYILKLE